MKKFLSRLQAALEKLHSKLKGITKELKVIYLAYKRPDVPWYAKLVAALVVGYALSPIDLIPDFIPVLGYLDDLVLIPFGIALAIKLIPKPILAECRIQADEAFKDGKPKNWAAGAFIIVLWILVAGYFFYKVWDIFSR